MKNNNSLFEKFLQYYNDNTMLAPDLPVDENEDLFSDIMKDIVMSEQFYNEMMGERVEPDKFGCYSIFCHSFLRSTDYMYDDFPYIAHNFLSKCSIEELKEYTEVVYSPDTKYDESLYSYILNEIVSILVSGLSHQNDYVCKLLINIYKVFYKKEYKYLKRFSKINASEVISISQDAENGHNMYSVARILCMCEAMHIQIMPNCDGLYLMLNKLSDMNDKKNEEQESFISIDEKDLMDGLKWIEEIEREIESKGIKRTNRSFIEQLKERDIMYSKEYKPWQRAKKIVQYACDSVGCNTDYVDKCGGSYYDESTDLAEMHAILKLLFPKEDISFEEKQTLTVLYGSVKALLLSIMQSADLVDELLGFENYDENSMEERLFNESMFPEKKQQGNNVVVEHKSIVKENAKEQRYAEQDLLDEIKQLREKIHSMEQKNAKVQHNILIKQKTSKEYDVLKEEYDAQKEELVALREFVYKMTDKEDIELPANDIDSMKETLANKKIVIIGGHNNWVTKLRNIFPDWTYLSPKTSGTVDNKVVSSAEFVYFFTDYIKHSTYNRFISIVREEKKPFGYIHSINIESNIQQIYEETKY